MTNQPQFQGMEPAARGRLHEQTLNIALAQALRQRRQAWRDSDDALLYERTGVLADGAADRPDILVQTPDIYPVVLEVEYGDPAFADARGRLGQVVIGSTDPIRSAIAIGAPAEIRQWSDRQLADWLADPYAVELKYAILSANIRGDEGEVEVADAAVHYWPAYPNYVTGNLEDLAVLCEYAAAPPPLVADMAARVAAQINNLADALQRGLDPETAYTIARQLGQTDPAQGLRMACCIWLTSLRLQNLLAGTSVELQAKGLKTVAEMRSHYSVGRVIVLDELRDEWAKILEVNYRAIFNAALNALHPRIPDEIGSQVLTELSVLAGRITSLRLGNRVDFAGELFPKLLSDRGETAAHYTLPETAELLSQMAVSRLALKDAKSPQEVAAVKIADFACGTGSLLRASYRHIRSRHDAAGGTGDGLHRRMMEDSITGLDINALAAHMTAAGLSAMEMATEYHRTNIAAVPVPGGKTGSLELLAAEQITDVVGQLARTVTANQAEPVNIAVPNESRDLVIQNPPYYRAHGNHKMFDVAGISEPERKRSEKRLSDIRAGLRRRDNEIIHGQAGMGADFSALADRKLKTGGVFAAVLPLSAAHSESWTGFRKTLEAKYNDITAIAFTPDEGGMLSADTHMNEMLVIASKGQRTAPQERILCINLNDTPESVAEAYWYAKLLNDLGQPERGGNLIHGIGKRVGSWIAQRTPSPGFPWFVVGMQNHHLARAAAELIGGRLYSMQGMETWEWSLKVTTLGQVAGIGPTHHRIGHQRGQEKIGAFTFDPILAGQEAVYPSLWTASPGVHRSILSRPTHEGDPYPGRESQQRDMLDKRSDLFISRGLRMTSQSLAMVSTNTPAMGSGAWNALQTDDADLKAALAIWGNSTLSLIIRVCYAQTTQQGRATMQVKALAGFPVPDFAAAGPAGEQARRIAQERYGELAALTLEPVSYAFRDENRQRIDAAALAMVGLGDNAAAARAVAHLRNLWCREPAVHGGSDALMRALGLRRERRP